MVWFDDGFWTCEETRRMPWINGFKFLFQNLFCLFFLLNFCFLNNLNATYFTENMPKVVEKGDILLTIIVVKSAKMIFLDFANDNLN